MHLYRLLAALALVLVGVGLEGVEVRLTRTGHDQTRETCIILVKVSSSMIGRVIPGV
jgi:hypothetical protein